MGVGPDRAVKKTGQMNEPDGEAEVKPTFHPRTTVACNSAHPIHPTLAKRKQRGCNSTSIVHNKLSD